MKLPSTAATGALLFMGSLSSCRAFVVSRGAWNYRHSFDTAAAASLTCSVLQMSKVDGSNEDGPILNKWSRCVIKTSEKVGYVGKRESSLI